MGNDAQKLLDNRRGNCLPNDSDNEHDNVGKILETIET